jgi:flagellin
MTTGDISRVGLTEGNFSVNQSVFNTATRDIVEAPVAQTMAVNFAGDVLSNESFSVTINGITFETQGVNGRDTPKEVRDLLIDAINDNTSLGVSARAGRSSGELLLTSDVAGSAFTLEADTDTADGRMTVSTVISNQPAQYKVLQDGDLLINGVPIGASKASNDSKSNADITSSSKAASAISIAEAINAHSFETGVRALANPAQTKGLFTDLSAPESGIYSLYLNGVEIEVEMTKNDPSGVASRVAAVVNAVNERSGQHGITAYSNGEGVTLESDGRNMSVWFDSQIKGLSAASFGLGRGGEVAQISRIAVGSGVPASSDVATVLINGVSITTGDLDGLTPAEIAAEIKDAFDTAKDAGDADSAKLQNISVSLDGNAVILESLTPGSGFTLDGVDVSDDSELNLQIGVVQQNSRGDTQISALAGASSVSEDAATLYGTVRMISDPVLLPRIPSPYGTVPSHQQPMVDASGDPFRISAGDKGFLTTGNFSSIGFQEGSFGGRASSEMEPPKVGRLAFQVGATAGQLITIDLADFGKNGSITSEITSDVDLNVEERTSRINTRDGASSVLQKLDDVMERINATRADMGAIMNRLQHAMDNLSNVSMNQEASRSQIQDADYAKASTELAKSQIMQQAATAVLAQANSSQQTVLQLLQG